MAFKKSFNKPFKKSFGGGKSFGNSARAGGHTGERSTDRPVQMFSAVCANCGKTCEVPFRPSPGRSVFCRDCFHDGDENARNKTHGTHGARGTSDMNTRTPYKPQPTQEDKRIGEIKWLVEKVENKIDSIIVMLEKQGYAVTEPIEKKKVSKEDKKAEKKTEKNTAKKA